jgi:septal ring factor EnvC (AmiA/AmiB activator)
MFKHAKGLSLALVLIALSLNSPFTNAAHKEEKSKDRKTKDEKPKEKLNNIHERIESLTKELGKTKEAHDDAADALKESEKAISETNRKLFELQQAQKKHSESLQVLQSQKTGLENTIEGQKNQLSRQIYQQYLHGQQNYLQVILQEQDPSALSRQLQYFSYIARARQQLISEMQSNLGRVSKLNEETASALQEVTNLKESKRLYKTIANELETRKPISESVENKIIKEATTSTSRQLNESTAYVDPSTKRIMDLIHRVEKR